MTSPHVIMLLTLVREESALDPLLLAGLEFAQLSRLIDEALQDELLGEDGEDLFVTDKGEQLIAEHPNVARSYNKKDWIQPQDEFLIEQLPIEEIYLPLNGSMFED